MQSFLRTAKLEFQCFPVQCYARNGDRLLSHDRNERVIIFLNSDLAPLILSSRVFYGFECAALKESVLFDFRKGLRKRYRFQRGPALNHSVGDYADSLVQSHTDHGIAAGKSGPANAAYPARNIDGCKTGHGKGRTANGCQTASKNNRLQIFRKSKSICTDALHAAQVSAFEGGFLKCVIYNFFDIGKRNGFQRSTSIERTFPNFSDAGFRAAQTYLRQTCTVGKRLLANRPRRTQICLTQPHTSRKAAIAKQLYIFQIDFRQFCICTERIGPNACNGIRQCDLFQIFTFGKGISAYRCDSALDDNRFDLRTEFIPRGIGHGRIVLRSAGSRNRQNTAIAIKAISCICPAFVRVSYIFNLISRFVQNVYGCLCCLIVQFFPVGSSSTVMDLLLIANIGIINSLQRSRQGDFRQLARTHKRIFSNAFQLAAFRNI